VAGLVFLLVSAVQVLARWTGLAVPPAPQRAARRAPKQVSTKMAIQLGVALAVAFEAGRLILPAHWQWVVLTAFIVCSGNRSRGDVLHKSLLRVGGAGAGTLVATGLLGLFGPGGVGAVITMLVVLGTGTVLRTVSYAYWAGCMTTVMALALGYFGEDAAPLLAIRLVGILLGGVIGVGASWLVLPIKSRNVARKRIAAARRALDALRTAPADQPDEVATARGSFEHAMRQLDLIAAPFEAQRWLHRLLPGRRGRAGHQQLVADTIDALRDIGLTEQLANEQVAGAVRDGRRRG
jgi:uncharacterized membrane protein YccC